MKRAPYFLDCAPAVAIACSFWIANTGQRFSIKKLMHVSKKGSKVPWQIRHSNGRLSTERPPQVRASNGAGNLGEISARGTPGIHLEQRVCFLRLEILTRNILLSLGI